LPFQPFHPSLPVLPGLVTGPTDALRNGVCDTGNEMLGPMFGYGTSTGRSSSGSSPRIRM
jgi:hypothetical protein